MLLHLGVLRADLRVDPALGDGLRAGPRRLHDDGLGHRDQLEVPRRRHPGLRRHLPHAVHLQHRQRSHRQHLPLYYDQHARLGCRKGLRRTPGAGEQGAEGSVDVATFWRSPTSGTLYSLFPSDLWHTRSS